MCIHLKIDLIIFESLYVLFWSLLMFLNVFTAAGYIQYGFLLKHSKLKLQFL